VDFLVRALVSTLLTASVALLQLPSATSADAQGDGTAFYRGPQDAHLAPRSALVVGISIYNEFPPLKNAANDARLIGDTLSRLGFNVYPKSTPVWTRQTFKRELYDYVQHVKKVGGASLIYFAGHGVSYGGASYRVPQDGMAVYSRDVREELIPLDLISDALKEMDNAFHIVVLDACRDPGLGKLPTLGSGEIVSVTAGVHFMAPGDVVLATSADDGQRARDGDGDDSPYALALSAYMQEPNEYIALTFGEVAQYFRRLPGNSGAALQEPTYLNKGGASFVFLPTTATFREEQSTWKRIDRANATSTDYQIFLNGYPAGYFADQARQLMNRPPPLPVPQPPPTRVQPIKGAVLLRDSPSIAGQVVASATIGTRLEKLSPEPLTSSDWTRVRDPNGTIGFIDSKLLTFPPTKEARITLTYEKGDYRPSEALGKFLGGLKYSDITEVGLRAYSRSDVGPAVARLIDVDAVLKAWKLSPKIVKTSISAATTDDQLDQVDVAATVITPPDAQK
jgi:hypothetical protein